MEWAACSVWLLGNNNVKGFQVELTYLSYHFQHCNVMMMDFFSWSGRIISVSGVWSHEGFGMVREVTCSPPCQPSPGPLCTSMEGQLWDGFKLCHRRKVENAWFELCLKFCKVYTSILIWSKLIQSFVKWYSVVVFNIFRKIFV